MNFQAESVTEPDMKFNLLFIIEANEGAKPVQISKSFWSFNNATWSADSKKIYAVCGLDSMQHPDRELNTEIVSVNLEGSGFRQLVGEKGISYNNPKLSSDGKMMVFTSSKIEWLGFNQLMISNADGSNKTPIIFDRAANNFEWSDDSKFVYFTANSNGGIPMYRLDVQSKKLERLSDFDSGISSFDITNDRIIFSKTEVKNPFELYSSDLMMKNQTKLSSHNDDYLKNKALSFPEKRIHVNSKGQKIEYWIMKPSNF